MIFYWADEDNIPPRELPLGACVKGMIINRKRPVRVSFNSKELVQFTDVKKLNYLRNIALALRSTLE